MNDIEMTKRFNIRHAAGRAGRLLVSFVLAVIVTAAFPWAPSTSASSGEDVALIGRLALPRDWDRDDAPVILAMEPASRRIVSVYRSKASGTDHLLLYDLRPRVPKISRNLDLGTGFLRNLPSPYLNVVDTKRDRLLNLIAPSFVGSSVQVVDLKQGKVAATWDLQNSLPGFVGWGITYSKDDDTIYVVGEVIGPYGAQNGFLFPAGSKPPVSAVILALNPADGSTVWRLPLPHCQPLNTRSVGTLIARSHVFPALYVPCARSLAYPNLAGVERIWIKPTASQSEALQFRQEFFPISGVWILNGAMRGTAAFDAPSDRILLQSLSLSTPGAWVFDGHISGWVGFVPTPGPYETVGVNEGSGHFYATTLNAPMLVSSIRGTPVPQGVTFDNARTGAYGVFVYTDADSNRFFISIPEKPNASTLIYGVYEDKTPDENPLSPSNYDALTSDLEEGPNTAATFAGGVRGFGARISAVGGFGGVWEGFRQMLGGIALPTWPAPGVSPGDRALVMASVPSIDLRNAGAASAAQAVAPDTNTSDEHRTKQTQIIEACLVLETSLRSNQQTVLADQVKAACNSRPLGTETSSADSSKVEALATTCQSVHKSLREQEEADVADLVADACESAGINSGLTRTATTAAWPWAPLACLDGGGDSIEQKTQSAGDLGEASIECRLGGESATAETEGPSIKFSVTGASILIGATSSRARAFKGPLGIITEITSMTTGFEIASPGVGSLSIGRVTAVARAVAHGRPDTADVSLDRTLERVVVRDAMNKVVRSVTECDLDKEACESVLDAANSLLAPRFRLYVPAADLRKTPKGAFAGAQKADAEYLNALNTQNDNSRILPAIEVIAYNDTAEKSRLVVQAAGVQVDSIYYLQRQGDTSGETTTIINTVQVPVDRFVVQQVQGPPQVFTKIVPRRVLPASLSGSLAVMVRSPKEALHLALIWVLFGGAIAAIVRRRALKRSLGA